MADADRLNDPDTWELYLGELRTGAGRFRAATAVGLTSRAVTAWLKGRPAKIEEAKDAALEAAEAVEAKLYEAALAGEPWAVVRWLKARGEGWADPSAVGGVTVAGNLNVLVAPEELKRMLEATAGPSGPLDVESVELPALPPAGDRGGLLPGPGAE